MLKACTPVSSSAKKIVTCVVLLPVPTYSGAK